MNNTLSSSGLNEMDGFRTTLQALSPASLFFNVVPYELQKYHRYLPEMPSCKNAEAEDKRQFNISLSRLREQEDAGNEATNRTLGQDKSESQAQGESVSKRSGYAWNDQETFDVSTMRGGTAVDSHSRPPPGLRKEITSGLAVSNVPPRRTFERRDLVPAEPEQMRCPPSVTVRGGVVTLQRVSHGVFMQPIPS